MFLYKLPLEQTPCKKLKCPRQIGEGICFNPRLGKMAPDALCRKHKGRYIIEKFLIGIDPKEHRKQTVKSARTILQKQVDTLWQKIIKKRDPICRICKSKPSRDAHHIISRSHKRTRFSVSNGLGLCYECHQPKGHDDPCNFRDRIIEEIGEDLYTLLKGEAKMPLTEKDYKGFLQEEYNRLKGMS